MSSSRGPYALDRVANLSRTTFTESLQPLPITAFALTVVNSGRKKFSGCSNLQIIHRIPHRKGESLIAPLCNAHLLLVLAPRQLKRSIGV